MMERFDSIIYITPSIGEYHGGNLFARAFNSDEYKFLSTDDIVFEYRMKHDSYTECMSDLKQKLKKIKKVLEE